MGNFFVRRPIVAMVIAIFTVIVGVVFLGGLPTEQYPNITPPIVEVRATYTGADAVSVEQSVATPLEQEINGVDNMIYMKSINANDGTMTIQVSFEVGTDPDMNTVFTQNRVAAATAKLPEEVKRFGVTTQKSLPNILMLISLTSEDGRYDQQFLGNYALINIKDTLARIRGIGRVNVIGASDYSMRIWIKPDLLATLGITVPEIVEAIRSQSVIVPGGKFGAEPAPPGTEFTYTVKLPERLQTEKEFGEIVIRTAENGSQVKIKHIARIELGVETYNAFTRLNGKQCGMIALYQAPGSNAVELAEQVRQTMEELAASFPQSIRYDISLDTTLAITAGIDEIIETLFIALALVILVVFIFIQDWRAALIPTIAIPVSLVGAFIVFPMIGFTINVLSLLGLVLAIGIVVDDAIVVVEAVQVKIEEGMDPQIGHGGSHEGGHRAGNRHHPGSGSGLYPGGRHGGHHRKALPAVCHHRGRFSRFFVCQCAHFEPGALCSVAQKTERIPRAPGAVFSRLQQGLRQIDRCVYETDQHRYPQNHPRLGLYRRGSGRARVPRKYTPRRFHARRRYGIFLCQHPTARRRLHAAVRCCGQ